MDKILELKSKIGNLLGETRSLKDQGKIEEAQAKLTEIRTLQKQLEVEEALAAEEKRDLEAQGNHQKRDTNTDDDEHLEYRDIFVKAFRGRKLSEDEERMLDEHRALSSTTGEDGGYLIPIDQDTKINELKRDFTALENFVTVQPVTTLTGSRVLEKNADTVPMQEFTEDGDVPDADTPKFVPLEYNIKDRGAFLPIPGNLMADSDQNILAYIENWVRKKDKATKNALILEELGNLSKKAVANVDDIKDIMNVNLDPAIEAGAIALTNQDGYNYLDKLKDADGKYILQPDPTQPGKKLINGKPLHKISNKVLKTVTDGVTKKAPLIIGDLKEAIVLWDRQQLSIKTTDVGGTAFKKNRTEMRAITRVDVSKFDTEAAVYGEITLP
ncbi:phage major capsid protein [Clostridium tunisiense]|uniref:phage major capsid protein n=1 Tax=Clostridium tunisiense TaxID=219748 RepID=UPI000315B376|nr:phage major capsid protein [Clostridium tunisiense]